MFSTADKAQFTTQLVDAVQHGDERQMYRTADHGLDMGMITAGQRSQLRLMGQKLGGMLTAELRTVAPEYTKFVTAL